jgi:hypothetical protein
MESRIILVDENGLSELRLDYMWAAKSWIDAIRAEESLATADHSMTAMERWMRTSKGKMRTQEPERRGTPIKTHSVKPTTGFKTFQL